MRWAAKRCADAVHTRQSTAFAAASSDQDFSILRCYSTLFWHTTLRVLFRTPLHSAAPSHSPPEQGNGRHGRRTLQG